VKIILQHKDEAIISGIYYITMGISYIIHVLRRKGSMAQRCNGITAQKGERGGVSNYFLEDTNITTPPTPITAIPIRGDQLR
jgi:hypothetical protein